MVGKVTRQERSCDPNKEMSLYLKVRTGMPMLSVGTWMTPYDGGLCPIHSTVRDHFPWDVLRVCAIRFAVGFKMASLSFVVVSGWAAPSSFSLGSQADLAFCRKSYVKSVSLPTGKAERGTQEMRFNR